MWSDGRHAPSGAPNGVHRAACTARGAGRCVEWCAEGCAEQRAEPERFAERCSNQCTERCAECCFKRCAEWRIPSSMCRAASIERCAPSGVPNVVPSGALSGVLSGVPICAPNAVPYGSPAERYVEWSDEWCSDRYAEHCTGRCAKRCAERHAPSGICRAVRRSACDQLTSACACHTRHCILRCTHSKPVPLWEVVSIALSVCARQWTQFWVGVAALGMGARNKLLAIKKIHPGCYNGKNLKPFGYFWHTERPSNRQRLKRYSN